MVKKTDPLLQDLNRKRVIVRTNVADYVKKLAITHGFILAGCAFLLRDLFSGAQIAADYTHAQDMMVVPWGTNHVTNPYFAGTDFALETLTSNVSRTEKVATLANDELALSTLTFCGIRSCRPENCGACNKCIRTKAMFVAMTGEYPPIFSDMSFRPEHIEGIDLANRKDYAFFAELLQQAERSGRVDQIPGLRSAMDGQVRAAD